GPILLPETWPGRGGGRHPLRVQVPARRLIGTSGVSSDSPDALGVFSESSSVRTLGLYDATRHSSFGEWRNDEATEVASRRGEPEADITEHETVVKAWLVREAPDMVPAFAAPGLAHAPAGRPLGGPGLRTMRLWLHRYSHRGGWRKNGQHLVGQLR